MDEMANRAILLGAGIFVTLIIATGVLYALTQMREVYSQVYETNISLQDMFSEFEEYDNSEKTGIEVINTLKKYKNNPKVSIYVENALREYDEYYNFYKGNIEMLGEYIYICTVNVDENTGKVTIEFNLKK